MDCDGWMDGWMDVLVEDVRDLYLDSAFRMR